MSQFTFRVGTRSGYPGPRPTGRAKDGAGGSGVTRSGPTHVRTESRNLTERGGGSSQRWCTGVPYQEERKGRRTTMEQFPNGLMTHFMSVGGRSKSNGGLNTKRNLANNGGLFKRISKLTMRPSDRGYLP